MEKNDFFVGRVEFLLLLLLLLSFLLLFGPVARRREEEEGSGRWYKSGAKKHREAQKVSKEGEGVEFLYFLEEGRFSSQDDNLL